MTGFYHCDKYPKCGCSPVESCHPMKEAHVDSQQRSKGEEVERRKREELDQWSLPYPQPANRAQRRANERAAAKRDREKEIQLLVSDSGPWKKDWKKQQKRKGGAKRLKK